MIHTYSTIFAIGHRAVKPLLEVPCIVEEKIDGSQFSFCKQADGEIWMRSKGVAVHAGEGGMFGEGADATEAYGGKLPVGYTFRGEYLQKRHHNVLTYDRVPSSINNVIIFDVETPDGAFLSYTDKVQLCAAHRLEVVPKLYEGMVTLEVLQGLLDRDSCLGGTKIEGIVIKPVGYNLWGTDKKVLMAKYVSERFKEKHATEWGNEHKPDIISQIVLSYRTEARWQKAVQHLREKGQLESSPRDIGNLIREVIEDVKIEEMEEIKRKLWSWAWKQIGKNLTAGLPEWYKMKLMEEAFNDLGYSGSSF